jgi:hypothetical protein
MDANGWVLISILASFNRIKNLTSDLSIVVECLRMTPLLEVSPKGTHVRLRQQWPEWVLPNAAVNEDVKKEFEEAEKEKEAGKSTTTEQVEKEEDGEVAPAVEAKEVKADEETNEATEESSKPSTPSADEVSIRSPTLKSQCEFSSF